ncbi:TrbI/VirB10 family protein [Stenotrophomonas sp. VV52]|uniref:TrbI/VirB10 family protein n=1 Tax=Stenotrophomonas sp. VV52 TaxID=2066958 RepID=UPI000C9EB3FE|nr:TrbI/VirB10 family protein [Stenotrophomonas sp. VV52]
MSQHTPGNEPHEPTGNPYYGQNVADNNPNLDAAAPQLRSAEEQRLNRKALAFLGGILVLVIAMGFLLLRKSSDDQDRPARVNEQARVSTPELPTAPPVVAPPPVADAQPIEMLPPLPPPAQDNPYRTPPAIPSEMGMSNEPRQPSLLDRRMASGSGVGGGMGGGGAEGQAGGLGGRPDDEYTRAMLAQLPGAQQPAPAKVRRGPDVEDVSNASFIRSPDALLVRGTYLRCVLETRIITDVAGFTSCLLTEPVYSINGRSLLLPKGSKIYGAYGGGPQGKRVEVVWDRITTPNGIDVAMSSPGIDQLGGAGHPGDYSAHWGSRIASALMISLIADAFKYAAAEHGPETTEIASNGFAVQSPYESATARSMERLANEALSERRPPTVTINQGTVVSVYVAKDVDFSDVLPRRR